MKKWVLSILVFVLFFISVTYATYEEPIQDIQSQIWKTFFKYFRDVVVALVPAYVTYLVVQGFDEIND